MGTMKTPDKEKINNRVGVKKVTVGLGVVHCIRKQFFVNTNSVYSANIKQNLENE